MSLRRNRFVRALSFVIPTALLGTTLPAAAATLDRIRDKGVITIGYRESSVPFSYLDERKNPVGYTIDLCHRVVQAVRRELKRPDLTIAWKPVTSANRIAAVQAGEVDLECGSTTSNGERRKQVAFTIPTFIASMGVMVRAGSGIGSINDLRGRPVVTTKGSTAETIFRDYNRGIGANLLLAGDHAESFGKLDAGQAEAFVMDDILLVSLRAAAKEPARFIFTRDRLTIEPLAIMLRKDDPAFKRVVDIEIARTIDTNEIDAIYRKWFESPIPPKGINLGLPMSYLLRDSFKLPTDELPN